MNWQKIKTIPGTAVYPSICGYDFMCRESAIDVINYQFSQAQLEQQADGVAVFFNAEELAELREQWLEKLKIDDQVVKNIAVRLEQENRNLDLWFGRRADDGGFEIVDNHTLQSAYMRFLHMYGTAVAVDTVVDQVHAWLIGYLEKACISNWGEYYGQIYYSVLSQPTEASLLSAEETDLFSLVRLLHDIREQYDISFTELLVLDSVKVAIDEHIKKHDWILYNYFGPIWEVEKFYERLNRLSAMDTDKLTTELSQRKTRKNNIIEHQTNLHQKIDTPIELKNLFERLHELDLLIRHKNDIWQRITLLSDELFEEVALRIDIDKNYLGVCEPDEVNQCLLYNKPLLNNDIAQRSQKSKWHTMAGRIKRLN